MKEHVVIMVKGGSLEKILVIVRVLNRWQIPPSEFLDRTEKGKIYGMLTKEQQEVAATFPHVIRIEHQQKPHQ